MSACAWSITITILSAFPGGMPIPSHSPHEHAAMDPPIRQSRRRHSREKRGRGGQGGVAPSPHRHRRRPSLSLARGSCVCAFLCRLDSHPNSMRRISAIPAPPPPTPPTHTSPKESRPHEYPASSAAPAPLPRPNAHRGGGAAGPTAAMLYGSMLYVVVCGLQPTPARDPPAVPPRLPQPSPPPPPSCICRHRLARACAPCVLRASTRACHVRVTCLHT